LTRIARAIAAPFKLDWDAAGCRLRPSSSSKAGTTTMADTRGDAPTPDEIRTETDRMTGSDVFSRSPQLGAFLRFVVEAVLHGRGERIKAYTIGVEVLRRDTKFDPQLDPIVRVEATRLRRAIERYYAGPGVTDPVVIDLPRGSYVPTFRRREMAPSGLMGRAVSGWIDVLSKPPSLMTLTIVAAILALSIAGVTFFVGRGTSVANAPWQVATLPPGNGMPTFQIDPIRVIGAQPQGAVSAERLYARVRDAFTRFDTISVATRPATSGTTAGDSSAERRSDYRLSGTIEYSRDTASAWFTLISGADGKVVWSRTFDRVQASGAEGVTEDDIVISLTNSLLQSYGVIRARDRAMHLTSSGGDPRYRCVLTAADAIRTADRRTHDQARACLEHLTMVDPAFAVGFTFLGLIYNREYQHGYGAKAGDSPALDRALSSVRKSISILPESSRGYLALMVVQSNRRDTVAALAAGERCLELNKYDMLALGEYGGRLVLAGQVDKGMTMLRQAGAHGAVRPSWHHIYVFIGAYVSGNMAEAESAANDIPNDTVPLGQVVKALAAHARGEGNAARQAIDRLKAQGGHWKDDPAGELARLIADPGIVARLARDLAAAGLRDGA
jgi:hypothetical protein